MRIGVPKEIKPQENRIGLTPDSVKTLVSEGHEVLVENNGGFEAGFDNDQYKNAGAKIIKKAIKETERRRNIQLDYNKKNKISATTVKKEISDVLESVYEKDYVKIGTGANVGGNLKKHIKALNKKMKESATNLEFEEAAKIRDEIRKLESTELEVTLNPKVKQYSLNNKIYPKGRSTMGMPGTRAQKGKKKWKQIKS